MILRRIEAIPRFRVRIRRGPRPLRELIVLLFVFSARFVGCNSIDAPDTSPVLGSESLTAADVQTLIAHAVEQAGRLGQEVAVAVTDREGNVLGAFVMTGAPAGVDISLCEQSAPAVVAAAVSTADEAIQKARTAAFLSSNQHGFSTLTACFITRPHFPPALTNLPAGPLFGVPFSSLPGSDIQPNGSGLSGAPGGVPLYKNGILVGGLGVSGGDDLAGFHLCSCEGAVADEIISLGAVIGYAVPDEKRGDAIYIDGIRFLFANAAPPPGNFTLTYADVSPARGTEIVAPSAPPAPRFPTTGEVVLAGLGPAFDFSIRAGSLLTAGDVRTIIDQAAAQAARTRAAIRRPPGVPAQVFVSVVDVDGSVLGIWRTPEATLFSFDVSAQKARTALAFSLASDLLGQRLRTTLGLAASAEIAMSTRAVGFLSQDFFPPGIDEQTLGRPVSAGPFFRIQQNYAGVVGFGSFFDPPHRNGLTIFPGGIPLYKGAQLVGAIGISGDGVDQDDLISFAGARGFEPPAAIRSDNFFYDGVRLPYVKLPRQPELE